MYSHVHGELLLGCGILFEGVLGVKFVFENFSVLCTGVVGWSALKVVLGVLKVVLDIVVGVDGFL